MVCHGLVLVRLLLNSFVHRSQSFPTTGSFHFPFVFFVHRFIYRMQESARRRVKDETGWTDNGRDRREAQKQEGATCERVEASESEKDRASVHLREGEG